MTQEDKYASHRLCERLQSIMSEELLVSKTASVSLPGSMRNVACNSPGNVALPNSTMVVIDQRSRNGPHISSDPSQIISAALYKFV